MHRRRRTLWCWTMLCAFADCQDSAVSGLEGRWSGQIICFDGTSELNVVLTAEGQVLTGTAVTRTKENNTQWKIRGTLSTACDQDTCTANTECLRGFAAGDAASNGLRKCVVNDVCQQKVAARPECQQAGANCDPCDGCVPCQICDECDKNWLPLNFVLSGGSVQFANPQVKLWRFGQSSLRGTIRDFCADPKSLPPEVALHR